MTQETQALEAMIEYIQTVLEPPQSALGGLPICPDVQRARLQQLIQFHVCSFDLTQPGIALSLMEAIRAFKSQRHFEVMLIIHPDRHAMSVTQLQEFVQALDRQLASLDLAAFGGHPDDPFQIQTLRTRQDSYPNITI